MTRLLLVRHAHPAAGFEADPDPGLDDVGLAQAEAVAATLGPEGPFDLWTSPLQRARQTAAPLEAAWGVEAEVEEVVGEIPSPMDDLEARGKWLRATLARRWPDLGALQGWRNAVVDALKEIERDTVVVTHYVLINAAVGVATDDDRVASFSPDYASVTELAVEPSRLRLVRRGAEGDATVR